MADDEYTKLDWRTRLDGGPTYDREHLPVPVEQMSLHRKTAETRMLWFEGPLDVMTQEGLSSLPAGWEGVIALDQEGNPYPIDADYWQQNYLQPNGYPIPDALWRDGGTLTRENAPLENFMGFVESEPVPMVQAEGPFSVTGASTQYDLPPGWKGYLAVGSDGHPYPISAESYGTSYAPAKPDFEEWSPRVDAVFELSDAERRELLTVRERSEVPSDLEEWRAALAEIGDGDEVWREAEVQPLGEPRDHQVQTLAAEIGEIRVGLAGPYGTSAEHLAAARAKLATGELDPSRDERFARSLVAHNGDWDQALRETYPKPTQSDPDLIGDALHDVDITRHRMILDRATELGLDLDATTGVIASPGEEVDEDLWMENQLDKRELEFQAAVDVEMLEFGVEGDSPQANALRAARLEQQLALPVDARDPELRMVAGTWVNDVTGAEVTHTMEDLARRVVASGGDVNVVLPTLGTEISEPGLSLAPDPLRPDQVTVYSQPNCVQCNATYRALEKASIPYTTVDVSTDPDAAQLARDLGYQRAPVVVTPSGDHWSGYKPDEISAYAEQHHPAPADPAPGVNHAVARAIGEHGPDPRGRVVLTSEGLTARVQAIEAARATTPSGGADDPPRAAIGGQQIA